MPPARYLRREDEASLKKWRWMACRECVSSSAASCRTAVAVADDREAVFARVCFGSRLAALPPLASRALFSC